MSDAVYRLLLRLYPPELRRWEADMAEVFALQLGEARARRGWRGALQVWSCALAELVVLAPRQPSALIPAMAVAGTAVWFVALTWALENSVGLQLAYRHWIDKLGG